MDYGNPKGECKTVDLALLVECVIYAFFCDIYLHKEKWQTLDFNTDVLYQQRYRLQVKSMEVLPLTCIGAGSNPKVQIQSPPQLARLVACWLKWWQGTLQWHVHGGRRMVHLSSRKFPSISLCPIFSHALYAVLSTSSLSFFLSGTIRKSGLDLPLK